MFNCKSVNFVLVLFVLVCGSSLFSATATGAPGIITVILSPQEAIDNGARWSFQRGAWQLSGAYINIWTSAEYEICYRPIPGWQEPDCQFLYVSTSDDIVINASYTPIVTGLTVTLCNQEAINAGAQWSIDVGSTWHDSGSTVTDLSEGSYTITYKTITDWIAPVNESVDVTFGQTTSHTAACYVSLYGSLTVTLSPQGAIDDAAQWSIDGGGTWHDSGDTVSDLTEGQYTVTYSTVAGWVEPIDEVVDVFQNQNTDHLAEPYTCTDYWIGDFNLDCVVDYQDFAILSLAWLSDDTPTAFWNPVCDISDPADGIIDILDLYVFADDWLAGVSP